jgi:hypothetical protein
MWQGPEWAEVQRRMQYLDRHRTEMAEELGEIEEEQVCRLFHSRARKGI